MHVVMKKGDQLMAVYSQRDVDYKLAGGWEVAPELIVRIPTETKTLHLPKKPKAK